MSDATTLSPTPSTPRKQKSKSAASWRAKTSSPYFSAQSTTPPETPKRSRKRRLSSPVVKSPHFSGRYALKSPPQCVENLATHSALHSDALAAHATDEPAWPDDVHTEVSWDGLNFRPPCFRSKSFIQLHKRLLEAKPILIQETLADDSWKVLVVVTLLNKTAGKLAIPVFWEIIRLYPTPFALSQANEADVTALIQRLGCQTIRARRLIDLSRQYMQDPPLFNDLRLSKSIIQAPPDSPRKRARYPPTPISHLPGTGPYALDSYRIFCTQKHEPFSDEWKHVTPSDKELIRFLKWKWAHHEHKKWAPDLGVFGPIDPIYVEALIADLDATSPR
ncbi:hypothetical protein HGRIS_007758 [Hohenbuehelia grisea]|uniref:HhH-GPD domain-containing protein n=1 Tax=Hohenbuehelia grisea TaxID=104357 RepID=A0ABR3J688_9AGAR